MHRLRKAAAIINRNSESSAGVIDTKMIGPMEVQISNLRGIHIPRQRRNPE